jgi:hypothetical protein
MSRQVLQVADALEETLGLLGLKQERREEAVRIAGDLRDLSAEDKPDRGRLQELLGRAGTVAVSGTGRVVGTAVVALVQQALVALGLG